MNILIKNANLISMFEEREKYEECIDILIKNDIIEKIDRNIEANDNYKIIDATDKVVMPGIINTHAHVSMSFFRETLDGYTLQDWLEKKIWPIEDKLTGEDIYYGAYLSFIEMIKTGCTCINDMYYMPDYSIKAALETGVRLQTTRTLMSGNNNNRLNELKDLVSRYSNEEMITLNVGIHGLYTANEKDLEEFIKFAKEKNLNINMHFCENSKEVEDIKKDYQVLSPVDVIEKFFVDIPTILAHGVKLTNDEIERLGKLKNISISHCPVSNLRLGCGIANIQKMLERGILVSLGTDGQGSGSNLDMFETMKFTALLQKGINESPENLPAYEVLKMATINGAKALGLDKEIGTIEEGKKADLIILNIDNEKMRPINDILSDIVYNAKGNNVETTIINGNILMEDRKLLNIDDKNIYKICSKIINKII